MFIRNGLNGWYFSCDDGERYITYPIAKKKEHITFNKAR